MSDDILTMQPGDQRPIDFDYTYALPPNTTVLSATITALNLKTGLNADSVLVSTTAVVASPIVTGKYAGTAFEGEGYLVTATAIFSDGTVWKASRILAIRAS